MKKILLALLACISFEYAVFSQNVGIGTNQPHPSAKLEVASSKSGFLPPRMTTGQRDSIVNPAQGLMIFNTSNNCVEVYILGGWRSMYCYIPPIVSALNCGAYSLSSATISPGIFYSGLLFLPYSGGNGKEYPVGLPVASTGVSGLIATLQAGTLANGDGSLTFSLSGTPSAAGLASFVISFGGQSCVINVMVAVAPSFVGKWYYQSITDSAFCCKNLPAASRYAYPDSNRTYTLLANTYYVEYFADKTFSEYYLDGQIYPGTYTTGYSSFLGADSLNRDYGSGYIEYYRINLLNATTMELRDRITRYQNDGTGAGVLPNGDTLVYRLTWNCNK